MKYYLLGAMLGLCFLIGAYGPSVTPVCAGSAICQPIKTDPTITKAPSPEHIPQPTDEVRPTPGNGSPEQSTENPGTSPHEDYKPATCTVPIPPLPTNPQSTIHGKTLHITWTHDGTNITKWSLAYGYTPHSLLYGIPEIDKNAREVTIDGLDLTRHVWIQLTGYNTGTCGNSVTFDP